MSSSSLRVLTVGDGDLSYSLALARAYGDRIRLTASVLPTTEELVATYAAGWTTLVWTPSVWWW